MIHYCSTTTWCRVAHELKGEVAIHIHLRHPNIITLIGVVFEPKNYGVVLEYAPHGDLLHFLTKFRPVCFCASFVRKSLYKLFRHVGRERFWKAIASSD